ncbi:MAG: VCBS repeat-containing protein [Alphaproteobacteria bacterium]|nr:VCBS repeat-containing protein [Alphaproteobacteria bacterium]
MFVLLLSSLAQAELPLPTYPECGEPDQPELCPSDLDQDYALLGYVPEAWQGNLRPEEVSMGTGIAADRAWRVTTGDPRALIAVLDSGILWDDVDLRRKHYIDAGELPLPQGADGVEAASYDANGDGVFNVDDYADDPRVDPDLGPNGVPGLVDPQDLIFAFSDGVDDDGDGFIDDIAGWDFFFNDNDPYDDTRFDHGTYEAEESAKEGEDGRGGIGVCPNCMVLNVRVGDSFVADGSHFAAGALYAVDSGAHVVQEALGTLTHPSAAREAIDYAWDAGVLVVASAADETAYHQNSPGWDARALYVHAIVPDADADSSTTFLAYSNCTNHGARLELSATSWGCSSGATAMTAGTVGLMLSAAMAEGIELSPAEIKQLLYATVDDIDVPESHDPGSLYYPSDEGWDRFFGYGRIRADRAVEAIVAREIPPEVELTAPGWFVTLDPSGGAVVEVTGRVAAPRSSLSRWVLEVGAGDQPSTWQEIASGSGAVDGALARWSLETAPVDPDAPIPEFELGWDIVDREDAVNTHTATLRLRATDVDGREAVERRAVYLRHDPDLLPGFPLAIGASMESSPVLVDLDGDGIMEILQATSDGQVLALGGDGSALAGWPVSLELAEESDPEHPANHLASAGAAGLSKPLRAGVIGTPAAADLDGDGDVEVVVGSLRGALHAFDAQGQPLAGFPVHQERVTGTGPDRALDEGFFSSPALGDLDGDGDLEIVVGGMDQQLYAWHHDGRPVSGFPVRLSYQGDEAVAARIISSPAVGDVDGDGAAEIAIGTNEALNEVNGVLYLVGGDGQVRPGWPRLMFGAFTQVLPYVGEGVPVSPAMADVDLDGDLEIAGWTQAGEFHVFHHDGTDALTPYKGLDRFGEGSNVSDGASFPLINNPSFGDLDGDGRPELISGGTGADYAVGLIFDGVRAPFSHTLNAWDAQTGEFLPAFPRQMGDLQFFANPAVADIDGDRWPEVITGTAGFLVHAVDASGLQPSGWPKLTGQWNMASPAVGDIDGDGFLDVVQPTRGGWIFAWRTRSPSGATVAWAGFGHDAANTRNHEAPLAGYNSGYPPRGLGYERRCEGCSAGGAGGSMGFGLLLLLARRRRR